MRAAYDYAYFETYCHPVFGFSHLTDMSLLRQALNHCLAKGKTKPMTQLCVFVLFVGQRMFFLYFCTS